MSDTLLPVIEQLPVLRKSLRISVVTETYPPEVNGVSISVARFVEGLCALNHEIQLVRPRQDPADAAHQRDRFREVLRGGVAIPRYPGLRMGLPSGRALLKLWAARRPDVVHIVTEGPLGWSALQAALRLGIPVCTDFRTNFHAYSAHYGLGWLKRPIAAYLRKFHNRAARTLVPTAAMRTDLEGLGFRNVEVVARGVDSGLFNPARRSAELRRAWGAADDTPVVVHVGRLAAEKNLPTLAAAFEAMRVRRPNARFVVVGDGPERAALQDRCPYAIFAGQRSGEDLAAHYASGEIFLFPSLTETFGNVTLEAMACGLAVVAFDYAAAREHLRHGVSGMLANHGDSDGFVAMAADLVADPRRTRRFAQKARQAADRLTWESIARRFEAILLEVAQAEPGPAQPDSPSARRASPRARTYSPT